MTGAIAFEDRKPRGWAFAKGRADAFFSWPLQRLNETVLPAAISLRSLPDDRLAAELEELSQICGTRPDLLCERLMLRLYERERARRTDPVQAMDDQLDETLSRLERQTSETDRQLVHDIGRRLVEIGGAGALQAAARRMLSRCKPDRQGLRQRILDKRWEGLDA